MDKKNSFNYLQSTASAFSLYLGLDINILKRFDDIQSIWRCYTYAIDRQLPNKGFKKIPLIMISFPGKSLKNKQSSIGIFTLTPFDEYFMTSDSVLKIFSQMLQAAEGTIGKFSENIKIKVEASPKTFYKYTHNYKGSAFGLAPTIEQIKSSTMPIKTKIDGLYMCGHWTTSGLGQSGIPGVALSGRRAAQLILHEYGMGGDFPIIKV